MILLAGIGVGGDGRVLAPVNAAQIGFRNIGAQPDVIEIGQRNHRRSGRNHLSQLRLTHRDYAGRWGAQNRVAQIYLREAEIGAGFVQIGARDSDVFLAATLNRLVVTLLRRLIDGLGALQRGCGLVALLR